MKITIRDKHTGEVKVFAEVFEFCIDAKNINIVIESKNGWKKPYSFNKKDYEFRYIG